jgi:hypothetical protein
VSPRWKTPLQGNDPAASRPNTPKFNRLRDHRRRSVQKSLSSGRIQALLTSGRSPLEKCRQIPRRSDGVTVVLCGSSQFHLGTSVPSEGDHIITASPRAKSGLLFALAIC